MTKDAGDPGTGVDFTRALLAAEREEGPPPTPAQYRRARAVAEHAEQRFLALGRQLAGYGYTTTVVVDEDNGWPVVGVDVSPRPQAWRDDERGSKTNDTRGPRRKGDGV